MKLYNRNDAAARKVLTEIKRLIRKTPHGIGEDCLFIEVYENGREKGFAIDAWDTLKVAFAENRNSDDIVVYVGESRDFERNSNIPSEEVYESRKFFAYDEIAKAASFIFNKLKSA